MEHPKITLQVGDRSFVASQATFTRSSFLKQLITKSSEKDCFFLDRDPDVFVHILKYLVNNVYPLIYGEYIEHSDQYEY